MTALDGAARRVHRLDLAVALAGALVVAAAVVATALVVTPQEGWTCLQVLLPAVPLTALLSLQHVPLARSGGAVHVALDSGVLVLLVWSLPASCALLGWLTGVVVAQVVVRERSTAARVFNVALSALAGGVLLAVAQLLDAPDQGVGPRDLLALVLGTGGYLAVDLLLTGLSVAWAQHAPLREALADESVTLAGTAVLAANAVGLLAAVVAGRMPWALGLLVPLLLAPAHAARAGAAANGERRRSAALFDAAAEAQSATTREALEGLVVRAAARLTAAPGAGLTTRPPADPRAGALVRESDPLWLVVEPRAAGNAYTQADASALQVLAAVAGQALDRLELLSAMSRAASSDALTGLANRRELEQALRQALQEAGDGTGTGLVYLDLDDFKRVNDVHGHDVGDQLLTTVARRLLGSVREQDLVARWGGDEFVVLLRDTDDRHARRTAERLRVAVAGDVAVPGSPHTVLRVDASAGVALHRPGGTARDLLQAADTAMYEVKRARRAQPQPPGA